jgi:hypothetical protein
MAFGNYKIKADFGGQRITDRNSATAFMLTLTAIYRNSGSWLTKLCDKLPNLQPRNLVRALRSRPPLKPKVGWKIDLTPSSPGNEHDRRNSQREK